MPLLLLRLPFPFPYRNTHTTPGLSDQDSTAQHSTGAPSFSLSRFFLLFSFFLLLDGRVSFIIIKTPPPPTVSSSLESMTALVIEPEPEENKFSCLVIARRGAAVAWPRPYQFRQSERHSSAVGRQCHRNYFPFPLVVSTVLLSLLLFRVIVFSSSSSQWSSLRRRRCRRHKKKKGRRRYGKKLA